MSNYNRELHGRIKHAEGKRLLARGDIKAADECFRAVWASAKEEAAALAPAKDELKRRIARRRGQ